MEADGKSGRAASRNPADGLPTLQLNALRRLLDKRVVTPEMVAEIDYRTLAHATQIGDRSIEVIRAWLQAWGYDIKGYPAVKPESRREKSLKKAIELLTRRGYTVIPADAAGEPERPPRLNVKRQP